MNKKKKINGIKYQFFDKWNEISIVLSFQTLNGFPAKIIEYFLFYFYKNSLAFI